MRVAAALALILLPAAAEAQDLRELCTTRPSLGTSACIVDKGHVVAEVGVADWQRDDTADEREDMLLAGDLLVRLGVTEDAEVQVGWTAFGRVRTTDKPAGTRERRSRTGDVTLTWRQNLASPDGSGFSWGVQPTAIVPVGRRPVGGGDWGAELIVPVSYDLSDIVQIVVDPEVDAAVDEDGDGRHLAYGGVAGVQIGLSEAVSTTLELSAFRDRDPEDHVTELLAALTFAWQPTRNLQFDAGGVVGLNHDSPDVRLLTGVSARF